MEDMGERAPYSRVYWEIRDDPKFDSIRADDHHLATWLRLLVTADMAYPASADLPAAARRASVKALVDAGLIDLLPGGMFRVRGLAAERERRSHAAMRYPVGDQKGTSREPEGPGTGVLRLDEQSKDKQSKDEQVDDRDSLDRFYELTTSRPWGKPSGEWLKRLESEYGLDATTKALEAEHRVDHFMGTLFSRTEARLAKAADQATTKVREERKAKPRPIPEWRKIAKEWAEWDGKQLEDEERERAGNGVSQVSEAEVDRGILPG